MKRYILVGLVISFFITPVHAKEYQSSFGFTVNIPEHWLVLTRQELRDNPDVFDFDKKQFGEVEKNLMRDVISRIESGRVEIYYNQETSDSVFSDNINVVKTIGRIPENEGERHDICSLLPGQLSSVFGREIKVHQCKLKKVNQLDSLFLEFDGVVEGTRSIQYQIQKSSSISIVITATCKNSTLETMRNEFENIIHSIKMK